MNRRSFVQLMGAGAAAAGAHAAKASVAISHEAGHAPGLAGSLAATQLELALRAAGIEVIAGQAKQTLDWKPVRPSQPAGFLSVPSRLSTDWKHCKLTRNAVSRLWW